MVYLLKMVIFSSHVSLPEGNFPVFSSGFSHGTHIRFLNPGLAGGPLPPRGPGEPDVAGACGRSTAAAGPVDGT